MPTLFRLIFVLGVVFAIGYASLHAIATFVKPQKRTIVEAVALPESASMVRTGRSVAETLNHQASSLVHRHRRSVR